jgi:cysteinyl-tRNA synthetase
MSKSLGNFFTIRDVTQKFDPEAVRLYLLSTHYRSPIDFADEYLREARGTLDYLYRTELRAEAFFKERDLTPRDGLFFGNIKTALVNALEDDFNSAEVTALLLDTAKKANQAHKDAQGKAPKERVEALVQYYSAFRSIADVLGLLNRAPNIYFRASKAAHLKDVGMTGAELDALVEKRNEARKSKNFAEADAIRKSLLDKQIEIEDTTSGTEWWVKR